jgi:hypothetical protein
MRESSPRAIGVRRGRIACEQLLRPAPSFFISTKFTQRIDRDRISLTGESAPWKLGFMFARCLEGGPRIMSAERTSCSNQERTFNEILVWRRRERRRFLDIGRCVRARPAKAPI